MSEAEKKRTVSIELTAEQRRLLRMLRTSPAMGTDATLEQVIAYILSSVCDGVRREGSWEAGCVASMFGDWYWEPPPLCSVCEFEVLDEDDELEIESKRCETCLIRLVDDWEQSLPEDAAEQLELCERAFAREPPPEALRHCWERMKADGFTGPAGELLAPEATPVQCNGDAKSGRATSDALPSADDSKG